MYSARGRRTILTNDVRRELPDMGANPEEVGSLERLGEWISEHWLAIGGDCGDEASLPPEEHERLRLKNVAELLGEGVDALKEMTESKEAYEASNSDQGDRAELAAAFYIMAIRITGALGVSFRDMLRSAVRELNEARNEAQIEENPQLTLKV